MSRLRTDQACLDAQLRQQVERQLTAELAQPRDTIPCPAPAVVQDPEDRPVCACGQTVWAELPCLIERACGLRMCSDCLAAASGPAAPLDRRIAETRGPDRVHCAWSSPSSEGESW